MFIYKPSKTHYFTDTTPNKEQQVKMRDNLPNKILNYLESK